MTLTYEQAKEQLKIFYEGKSKEDLLPEEDRDIRFESVHQLIEAARVVQKEEDQNFISVGWHKGEMDFSVNCSIADLSYEQMKSLREMIVVGIGQAERMWSQGQTKSSPRAAIL